MWQKNKSLCCTKLETIDINGRLAVSPFSIILPSTCKFLAVRNVSALRRVVFPDPLCLYVLHINV